MSYVNKDYDKERTRIQGRQILFGEAILFISPLMEVHATTVHTRDTTKESHTVFCSPITRSHNIFVTTRRRKSIDSCNGPRSIFLSVIRDIKTNDRSTSTWRCALDEDDLDDFPILAKILV